MPRACAWLVGTGALFLPMTAQANSGIGFFMVSIPFLVLALVPAILVEAPILSRFLEVSFQRGLWWSFLANVVSTILGAIIGFAADMVLVGSTGSSGMTVNRFSVLVSLVPMFFLTWWLERATVRGLQPKGATQSPRRATLVANAASYSLLAIAMIFFPSVELDFPPSEVRPRLGEAFMAMAAEKAGIAEHVEKHGRFPEPRAIPGTVKYLRSLSVEAGGRVVAVLRYPGLEAIDGKTIILEPRMESGRIAAWDCHTPDAAYKYLPANCRQGLPASQAAPR